MNKSLRAQSAAETRVQLYEKIRYDRRV